LKKFFLIEKKSNENERKISDNKNQSTLQKSQYNSIFKKQQQQFSYFLFLGLATRDP